jgi:beta-xylosidase
MDKMISPTQLEGNPKQIISHHKWQEGPCLQIHGGKYYLTYSCGAWTNHTYHVRYAIGDSPEGPFIEQPEKLLESNEMVRGPGHHAMFTDLQERDWIVYHGWDTAHTGRYPRLDRIYFEDGRIKCDGPTFTQQEIHR